MYIVSFLIVSFVHSPLPQTVWHKGGQPLLSTDRVTQGNYGKSLIIKVVDFEDQGTYTCEVSNGVGDSQSYSINLKVLGKPFAYVCIQIVVYFLIFL